jgi:hypothetical protein
MGGFRGPILRLSWAGVGRFWPLPGHTSHGCPLHVARRCPAGAWKIHLEPSR